MQTISIMYTMHNHPLLAAVAKCVCKHAHLARYTRE